MICEVKVPRYKYQLGYLATFSKFLNGGENVFHKWLKSDLNYNQTKQDVLHKILQTLADEQLEGSVFVFQYIEQAVFEIYKINGIQASSCVELSKKYKQKKSIIIIQNADEFCFLNGV